MGAHARARARIHVHSREPLYIRPAVLREPDRQPMLPQLDGAMADRPAMLAQGTTGCLIGGGSRSDFGFHIFIRDV